jgi:hypothetical protein
VGVEQVQLLEHDVDRQHRDDRRHDPVRDDPELDVVVAEASAESPRNGAEKQNE